MQILDFVTLTQLFLKERCCHGLKLVLGWWIQCPVSWPVAMPLGYVAVPGCGQTQTQVPASMSATSSLTWLAWYVTTCTSLASCVTLQILPNGSKPLFHECWLLSTQLSEAELPFQVGTFSQALAITENNTFQQTEAVLDEVARYFDAVASIIRNTTENTTISPMVLVIGSLSFPLLWVFCIRL